MARDAAFESLTPRQKEIIAAAERRAASVATPGDFVTQGFGHFNQGAAKLVGAPADLLNFGMGAAGLPVSDKPFLGSAWNVDRVRDAGAGTHEDYPTTLAGFVGSVAGEAAAAAVPLAKGVQLLAKGTGVTASVAGGMNRSMVGHPVASFFAEAGGATGAGVGRFMAEGGGVENPGWVRTWAEITGGMAGAMTPHSYIRWAPGMVGGRAIHKYTRPFFDDGALDVASSRVRSLASDPELAAQRISELRGTGLSASARTGEPGLMLLEQAVLNDPTMAPETFRFTERTSKSIADAAEAIRVSGNARTPRAFMQARKDRLDKSLTARVELAAQEAAAALGQVDPGVPPSAPSVKFRSSLEKALTDARLQEGELWNAIPNPQEVILPTGRTRSAFEKARSSLSDSQASDMPASAKRIVTGLSSDEAIENMQKQFGRVTRQYDAAVNAGNVEEAVRLANFGDELSMGIKEARRRSSLFELDGLYKKLGEDSRIAREQGRFNKARVAEEIRDGILEDLGMAGEGPEVKEAVQAARQFSLSINEKFRRGAAGNILGFDRLGGNKLDPTLSLDVTVGQRGQRGRVAVDELRKSVDEDLGSMDAMQEYVKGQFMREAVVDGTINPGRARSFMRGYADVLDAFPHLREQLDSARHADDVWRRVKTRNDAWRKKFDRPEVSAAARYLNADVGKEIAAVMNQAEPVNTLNDLVKSAKGNKDVIGGLKAGMSEWLIDQFTSDQAVDAFGRPVLNGLKLQRLVNSPPTRSALATVFTPDELARIDRSAEILATYHKSVVAKKQFSGTKVPITTDETSAAMQIAGRVVGAKGFNWLGKRMFGKMDTGPGLVMAQAGSAQGKKFVEQLGGQKVKQLIVDALIGDPDSEKLMQLLVWDANLGAKPFNSTKAQSQFRAWLAGPGARVLEDLGEDEGQ